MIEKIKIFTSKYKKQSLIIFCGLFLFVIVNIVTNLNSKVDNLVIMREDYDGEDIDYNVDVFGLTSEKVNMDIKVSKRAYTKKEADKIFDECILIVQSKILGDNTSLFEVNKKLVFDTTIDKYGVKVSYFPDNLDYIDYDGNILYEDTKKDIKTYIDILFSLNEYKREYQIPITILKIDKSTMQYQLKQFYRYLEEIDKNTSNNEVLRLPTNYKNMNLKYKTKTVNNSYYILVFSILISVLLYLKDIENIKQKMKKKRQIYLLEYPEILSKFILYSYANFSIRNTFEIILRDYEIEKSDIKKVKSKFFNKIKKEENITVYNEIKNVCLKLNAGEYEEKVYFEFGRACDLRQYMKFASILEQNRKSGLGNFRQILESECDLALQNRINIAKRLGEEASTKLLLPLVILLFIVMMIVIVPAVLAF